MPSRLILRSVFLTSLLNRPALKSMRGKLRSQPREGVVKLAYRNYVDFVGLEEEGGPGGDEGLRIWRRGR